MTYFQLRKRDPEDEPEEDVDEEDTDGEEAPEEEKAPAPSGLLGALWTGFTGPGRWLTAHGRVGVAWVLYPGSVWAVSYYGGWVAFGVPAAWLVLVLLFMPREFKDRVTERAEGWHKGPDAAPEEAAPEPEEGESSDPYRVLVGWLDDLTRGRAGIHLDELHQALTVHPHLAGLGRPEMRAWLGRHHITVDRTLRVGKLAGRSGVSRATVEALIKALPPLLESGPAIPLVHAPDLRESPVESGLERGGERAT